MFWPSTLNSSWYRDDVVKLVPRSIEGLGEWFSNSVENLHERIAYRCSINRCRLACSTAYSVDHALEQLQGIKQDLEREPALTLIERVLTQRGLRPDTHRYRMLAVDHSLELVCGIRNKFVFN